MEKATTKPNFREVGGIINLADVGLTFNAQGVGPMNFPRLRKADYGPGFRMPTMSELVSLVHASLENPEYESARNVVRTLRNHWLTGNTGILYTKKGMFVQDNPKIKYRSISMDKKTLDKILGSHEGKRVVFSDNRKVRFVPYGFKTGEQTPSELSRNLGVIALVDGEENAEKTAKASEHYRLNPYFWVLSSIESSQPSIVAQVTLTKKQGASKVVSVAVLDWGNFGDRLGVGASGSEDGGDGCSFGVK